MPREVETCPAVAWLDVKPAWPRLAPTVFNPCAAGVLCSILFPDPPLPPILFLRKFFSFSNFVDEQCSETKPDAGVCAQQAWASGGPTPYPASPASRPITGCLPPGVPSPVPAPFQSVTSSLLPSTAPLPLQILLGRLGSREAWSKYIFQSSQCIENTNEIINWK